VGGRAHGVKTRSEGTNNATQERDGERGLSLALVTREARRLVIPNLHRVERRIGSFCSRGKG
jgi:hypothetical protein